MQEIERKYAHLVHDVVVLSLTDETFRLILYLHSGCTLRVTERWRDQVLFRYSYYWLASDASLKIGWDNVPHHRELENFPHHKHIGEKGCRVASYETSLDDVIAFIAAEINSEDGS
ncbi:toxin-antitoxin system TumE family protein [Candidatus Chloroploca asiatica]|uniref:Uncharacterized protein n=1 Tax=Candidatus Chloroploca asiatica TaxID=1506545 RepID=A0A2H3KJ87_9CHLR|nr:DUF6516 family protein [Candidatus Chloroploca asiatica]PDV97963.1 hypothetical protein A9Q02_16615 [Candidatus Chloroploca asiatica]